MLFNIILLSDYYSIIFFRYFALINTLLSLYDNILIIKNLYGIILKKSQLMKKIIVLFMLCSFISFTGFNSFSQKLDKEATYQISGKAKRGALAKVDYDDATGNYTLIYVTKSTEKKAKFETYTFDKDFNFINKTEEEIEFDKAKTKYTWFKWNGELYSIQGNYVQPNLVGTLVLKEKKITYKYDWLILGYYKTTEILKKVKPKIGDRKLHYYAHAEDDKTGEIYVLCGIKPKMKDMKDKSNTYMHAKNLVVVKFNPELELVKEVAIDFEYPQHVAFSRTVSNISDDFDAPEVGGMAFVFAPMGGPGMNKYADPDNCNYTYVHVDRDLNIIDNIKFKSNASFWKVDELVRDVSTEDMYLFGPLAAGKDKYYNVAMTTTKFKAVQLLKISNHKVDYLTETSLDDFEAKLKTPPSQKKSPAYKGKKFEIANYKIASNGDFFVFGQNFNKSKEGNKYTDVLSFHFDSKGVLKAQYGIDILESNKYAKAAGTPQFMLEGADGKSAFWFLQEIKGTTMFSNKLLTYPRIGKVDVSGGSLNDFQAYGKDSGYYLNVKHPYLETSKGNTVVFFGEDKKGKTIWFLRVLLQ